MKKTKFLVAGGCGVALSLSLVWACNKASNDDSNCSAATTCAGTNPSQANGGGWTCGDAKHVNQIKKTCTNANDETSTCNDGTPVNCSQSTHCDVLLSWDQTTN